MKRLIPASFILAFLFVLALAPATFGQADKPERAKPAAKVMRTKPAAKPVPAQPKAKPAPAQPAAEQQPQQPQPQQQAQEQPLLGEDEPLPFMRVEETNTPSEPSSSGLILKSVGALLLVIGLLVFGTWSMKKLGFGSKAAKGPNAELGLEVLSTMPMGGGKTLTMVQFGERVLLVGSTAQSFTLLAEQNPQENTFATHPARSVADMLADDDEGGLFDDEFERAMAQIEKRNVYGGVA
jgi:flagellar biogenesis protein FliO/Na+-transporting methylmalonyl-CoA/oxaloacetate decarboxylase gamma subunit